VQSTKLNNYRDGNPTKAKKQMGQTKPVVKPQVHKQTEEIKKNIPSGNTSTPSLIKKTISESQPEITKQFVKDGSIGYGSRLCKVEVDEKKW
jgi:hypothetical protein